MRLVCLSTVFLLLGYFPFQGSSLECYVCNSDYDPRCGDPFSNYTIGKLDCSLRTPPEHLGVDEREPKVCRKITQKVQGTVRVLRTCGYLLDPLRDDKMCQKRSGTKDVQLEYCSCTTDLCNASPSNTFMNLTFVAVTLAVMGLTL